MLPGTPSADEINKGLVATEKLIGMLRPLKELVIPAYSDTASSFEQICKRLLDANESVVRWINAFRDFDTSDPALVEKFRSLAAEYRVLKTGHGSQDLKFHCSEIETIYNNNIRGKLRSLFGGSKLKEAEGVFNELCQADALLVGFVHEQLFGQLDMVCTAMEQAIDKNDLRVAENARLEYKVRSESLVRRLQEIGNGLADLVVEFRKVTS
jgi:hypothetical protein